MELEANHSLRRAIRSAIEDGLPTYAECGGLMYLSKRIHWDQRSAEMVGALPCEVELTERPQGHGYVQAEIAGENPFWPLGIQLRGHEFHNSRISGLNGSLATAYRLKRGTGLGHGRDGLVYRNVLASYTHLHADGSPEWAQGLVAAAHRYAQERGNG
jgi:cobyrinic acid a,c-diamide synthase